MKQRSIDITVRPDGGVTLEALNYEGADCEAATRFLEEALGVTTKRNRKPEYYKTGRTRNTRRQQLGGQEP